MSGIYIHIPFCKQLCHYCDFYFSVSLKRKDEVLKCIGSELLLRSDLSFLPDTLYFGGGTPSVCHPDEIKFLIDSVKRNFGSQEFDELTVEVNPDDLNEKYLEDLLSIGVNRLSIGVQSFIDEHLIFMNRRHTARQAKECVKMAKNVGFDNINIDLIYGIPQLTKDQWIYNLETFINLDVAHLSAYHLGIEPKTIFYKKMQRGEIVPINEDKSVEQYDLLEKITANCGFKHYEISNFAKNGKYSKHNTAYWQDKPYLGFGPSAHSYNGKNERRWNISNNIKYCEFIAAGKVFWESEKLNLCEMYDDYLLTSLRTMWGADTDYVERKFGDNFLKYFLDNSQRFISQGLLISKNNKIKIPSKHFLLSDGIIRELFFEKSD